MSAKPHIDSEKDEYYEFCPNCDANLTLQKGYDSRLAYWICLGCGEVLINPQIDSDIAWICDECGSMLNIQKNFTEECESWICTKCGHENIIDETELYLSEDEYLADKGSPFKGLSNEDMSKLSLYKVVETLNEKGNAILVRNTEDDRLYVMKMLENYDRSIYDFLLDNPISYMPIIYEIFEGDNCLIVIEEYIEGKTLSQVLDDDEISESDVVKIVMDICEILNALHSLPRPIIHRDLKPLNVMVAATGEIYLLDVNAAKWYDSKKNDDTKYMGTPGYAAPEQAGFGLTSSSPKTDIYALGVMMNVMITGRLPKDTIPTGKLGEIIRRCISMDAKDRYSIDELLNELDAFEVENDREADG